MLKTIKKSFLAVVLAVATLFALTSCVITGGGQTTTDPTLDAQAALSEFTEQVTFANTAEVTTSFNLPAAGKKGSYQIPITWTSSNEAVIAITDLVEGGTTSTTHKKANVTRPIVGAEDVTVTLTAEFSLTYTKNDGTSATLKETKTYNFTVLAKTADADAPEDVATLEVGVPYKLGMYQEAKEKTLYALNAMSGFYGASTETLEDADDVYVEKAINGYYIYFLDGTTKTYISCAYELGSDKVTYHFNYKLTDNASTVWAYDATAQKLTTVIEETELVLGTKSSYYTFSADEENIYFAHFYESPTASMSEDEKKVAADAKALEIATTVTENITLPATGANGSTITWESSNTAAIAVDGTVVQAAEDVVVTLVATIKSGEASEVVEFEVKVIGTNAEELSKSQITYDFTNGTEKGVSLNADTALELFENATISKGKLSSVAVTGVYNGNGDGGAYPQTAGFLKVGTSKAAGQIVLTLVEGVQVSKVVITSHDWYKKSDDHPTNSNTVAINGSATQLAPYTTDGTPGELTFELATPASVITIDITNRVFIFDITLYLVGNSGETPEQPEQPEVPVHECTPCPECTLCTDPECDQAESAKCQGHEVVEPEQPTDAEKLAEAKEALVLGVTEATENITLPAAGLNDVVITWVSNNEAIATDGTVTRGATDVEVTLTATLTLGEATDTKEFTVVVKAAEQPEEPETPEESNVIVITSENLFPGITGTSYANYNGNHTIGAYTFTTTDVLNSSSTGYVGTLQFKKTTGNLLNTTAFVKPIQTVVITFLSTYADPNLPELSVGVAADALAAVEGVLSEAVATGINVGQYAQYRFTLTYTLTGENTFISLLSKTEGAKYIENITITLAEGTSGETPEEPEVPTHTCTPCPECTLCTDPECDQAESAKCQGHAPVVEPEQPEFTVTIAEFAEEFLADWNAIATSPAAKASFRADTSSTIKEVFANAAFLAKYKWLFTYLNTELSAKNEGATSEYITDALRDLPLLENGDTAVILVSANTRTFIRVTLEALINEAAPDAVNYAAYAPFSIDYTVAENKNVFLTAYQASLEVKPEEPVQPTDAEKLAEAKEALVLGVTEATENITLPATGLNDVVITWVSNNEAIATDGTVTRGATDVEVTLTATLTLGEATDTKEFTVVVKAAEQPATPTVLATFELGANGSASHNDGTEIKETKSYTDGAYTLTITDYLKVYDGARDAQGNSCLKFGTSSATGSITFTVPENVTSVTIYVAKYKAKATKVDINGTTYTVPTSSDNGEYTAYTVDTTTVKTVTVQTVSGGMRAMVNTIVFTGLEA